MTPSIVMCVTCRTNVRPWIFKWSKRLISCTCMLVCSLLDRRILCSLWIALIIVGVIYWVIAMLNCIWVRHMRVSCIFHPHSGLSSMRRTATHTLITSCNWYIPLRIIVNCILAWLVHWIVPWNCCCPTWGRPWLMLGRNRRIRRWICLSCTDDLSLPNEVVIPTVILMVISVRWSK
jgi:hypothetical protein